MPYIILNNNVRPMSGGTSLAVNTLLPDTFRVGISSLANDWMSPQQYVYPEHTKGDANFYYTINKTSETAFVVSTGVYVDVFVNFTTSILNAATADLTSMQPYYTWLYLDVNSYVSIKDDNTAQQHIFNANGDIYCLPGVATSFQCVHSPSGDDPNRCACFGTYRYWIASNWDFALPAAAKLNFVSRLAVGSTVSEPLYLHFNNVPYISCPNEIDDEHDFSVDYNFPNLSQLEYIQFSLVDANDVAIIDYKNVSKTANSFVFSFTDDDKAKLYARYSTVNDANLSFSVKFKNYGDSPKFVAYPMHFTIIPAKPLLNYTLIDDNHIAPFEEVFVNLLSDFHIKMNPVAQKGARIVRFGMEHNGQAYINQNDVVFPSMTDPYYYLFCEDSRGNKTIENRHVYTWIDYLPPTCSITAGAPNTDGELPVVLSGQYYYVGDGLEGFTNGYSIYYKYTSNNDENSVKEWTQLLNPPVIEVDGDKRFTINFDVLVPNHADTYTIQIRFRDYYRYYDSNSVTVKSRPLFDWGQGDFNFNVPVTIQGDLTVTGSINGLNALNDDPAADYVVQTGSSGIWTYRLWNSGIAECWGSLNSQSFNINTAWGALYVKDDAILRQDYPFTFVETPAVTLTLYNTAGNCWYYTGTPGSTSKSPGFGLARGTAGNVTVNIKLIAVGRWK